MAFNWVDYAIIGTILLSMLISVVRGFVREALSLVTWIGAIWVGIHFVNLASQWLVPYITSSPIRMGVGFFLLFAVTLLVGSIVSFVLVQFIHKTGLSGTDRSLGVVFGLARGIVIVAVGLLIASMMFPMSTDKSDEKDSAFQTSHLAPQFKPIMNWLREFLPESPNPAKMMNLPDLSQ